MTIIPYSYPPRDQSREGQREETTVGGLIANCEHKRLHASGKLRHDAISLGEEMQLPHVPPTCMFIQIVSTDY